MGSKALSDHTLASSWRQRSGLVNRRVILRISPSHGSKNMSCVLAKSLQLCPTLCNPLACSPPGSSVHGILQARVPEWVAMPTSRGSSRSRDRDPGIQGSRDPHLLRLLHWQASCFTMSATWGAQRDITGP